MSLLSTLRGRAVRSAFLLSTALALGGCLEGNVQFELKPAGTVGLDVEARLVPEGRDVIALGEALLAVSPEMQRFADRPFCEAIVAGAVAEAPKARELALTAKQMMVGDRPACRFGLDLGSSEKAIENLQKGIAAMSTDPKTQWTWISLKSEGARRLRLTIDLGANYEDGLRSMDEVIALLRKAIPGDAPPPSKTAIEKVMKRYEQALVASYKMFERHYPGTKFEISLKAPRIVETNMKQDGNVARLVLTNADFIALAENPAQRKNRIYHVVFEY